MQFYHFGVKTGDRPQLLPKAKSVAFLQDAEDSTVYYWAQMVPGWCYYVDTKTKYGDNKTRTLCKLVRVTNQLHVFHDCTTERIESNEGVHEIAYSDLPASVFVKTNDYMMNILQAASDPITPAAAAQTSFTKYDEKFFKLRFAKRTWERFDWSFTQKSEETRPRWTKEFEFGVHYQFSFLGHFCKHVKSMALRVFQEEVPIRHGTKKMFVVKSKKNVS